MKFLVAGPGAMGCLFAARLKKAGNAVTLLDYRPERAELINRCGIRVEGLAGEYHVQIPVTTQGNVQAPDVVIICVKAGATRKVAEQLRSWLAPHIPVLTLQNGLGNVEVLKQVLGSPVILGGITAQGATLVGTGHVMHAGQGETVIGPKGVSVEAVEEIVSAFNDAGFPSRAVDNVDDLIWGKLVINVGINALTAITGLRNGRLPDINGTSKIMEEAVHEAVAVARAKGISLPYPDPLERVVEVCRATAKNIASMLQDVLNQKVTEVEFINGAIVREAGTLGLAAPVNFTLTRLIQTIEETYLERVSRTSS